MKYLFSLGVVLTIAIVIIFYAASNNKNTPSDVDSETPQGNTAPEVTKNGNSGGGVATGIITGRLCYPSSFLPEGIIEAKEIGSGTIASIYYEGSEKGGSNEYSLPVPQGKYILRYKIGEEMAGYHTDVCKTGMETTCASENSRKHIEVSVSKNQTVSGIDLCDFYYSQDNNPGF